MREKVIREILVIDKTRNALPKKKTIILSKCYWRSMDRASILNHVFSFVQNILQFIQNIPAARSTYKNSYRMQYVSQGRFLIPPKGYGNENKRINSSIQQNYIQFWLLLWGKSDAQICASVLI